MILFSLGAFLQYIDHFLPALFYATENQYRKKIMQGISKSIYQHWLVVYFIFFWNYIKAKFGFKKKCLKLQ